MANNSIKTANNFIVRSIISSLRLIIFIIMVDNAFSIFNKSASIVDNLINAVNILNRHVECYPQKSQYFQHGSCVIFHICHARTPSGLAPYLSKSAVSLLIT